MTDREALEQLADEIAERLGVAPEAVMIEPRTGSVCLTVEQARRLLAP